MSGGFFQKDESTAVGYSYLLKESRRFSQTTSPGEFDFLNHLNEQGASGARYVGDWSFRPEPGVIKFRSIFEVVDGARYVYEALPRPLSNAELLAQLNAQGAKGYRLFSIAASIGAAGVITQWIYVKDSNQASKFAYQILERPTNATDYLLQLKSQAERDAVIYATNFLSLDGTQIPGPLPVALRTIYSTSTECKGILCGELWQFSGVDALL